MLFSFLMTPKNPNPPIARDEGENEEEKEKPVAQTMMRKMVSPRMARASWERTVTRTGTCRVTGRSEPSSGR